MTDDHCPILADGVSPWDRGRHLFVKRGGRLARFRTHSRDFADTEIESLKHDFGQLYLDVSSKPAPDDFARDLVQLRRSPMCEPCAERDRCSGIFEPVAADVFTRDDARVRELLRGLTGAVLDVGCGEGVYEDVLAPLAIAGTIQYTGIDPGAEGIERLRARWNWARLRVATAEQIAAEAGEHFDHVLVLRSWNHLRDPVAAVAGIARSLRAGGTLTIVDNIAFGLARTRPQANRGETSSAQFEHYRNDSATDAEKAVQLAAAGLVLLEKREVSAATSNQWLLRYTAASSSE